MQTFITTKISKTFEDMMFQVAALYVNSRKYDKIITISTSNPFIEDCKMFQSADVAAATDYYELSDRSADLHKIIPFNKSVMLVGKFRTFKEYNEATLDFMRNFIYSNEDYMYAAYHKYSEIKKAFKTDDDNQMASIYLDDETNLPYYKKSLILMNKNNVVVFSSKELSREVRQLFDNDVYNVQVVWDNNIYVRFILMSLFRHNVCQYCDPFYSIWAAYISKYDELKTVIVPDYVKKVINENVNNTNVIYLD